MSENHDAVHQKPQYSLRKSVMRILISVITIYIIIVFIVTVFQRKIIYYPYKLDIRYEFPSYVPGMQEMFLTCEDGVTINGLFAPGRDSKPCILIFHGNAGNITHREFLIQGFNGLGYPVCIIDYHGYGKSEGTPSESAFYHDGEAVISWLKTEKNISPDQLVVFAKSIGSGVGCEMGIRYGFKGIILESPFGSTSMVAGSHFPYNIMPAGMLLIDKFKNIEKVGSFTSPVLIIHGERDKIIPSKNGKKLYKKAVEPKEIYLIEEAGHNNIQFVDPVSYWKKVDTWISSLK